MEFLAIETGDFIRARSCASNQLTLHEQIFSASKCFRDISMSFNQ